MHSPVVERNSLATFFTTKQDIDKRNDWESKGGETMIIYFTGTGNSRYVAQALAAKLDDELVDSFEFVRSGKGADFSSDKPWVFVSPTYAWRIPHVFEKFIRNCHFSGSTKAYFVMTCGSDIGNARKFHAQLCKDIGLEYCGAQAVVMPENYAAMFDVPNEEESIQIRKSAYPSILNAYEAVNSCQSLPADRVTSSDKMKSGIVNWMFYSFIISSKQFTVSDACIGCEKCANSCPSNGITLQDNRPVWTGACTHCMACICGCPTAAIEYGKKSVGKPRYICPPYEE